MTITSFSTVKLPSQITVEPAVSADVTNVKAAMSKVVIEKAGRVVINVAVPVVGVTESIEPLAAVVMKD